MLFSILIPVYNAEKNIEETVRSILTQTEQDFEIILLDDGSTDNSKAVCTQLSEQNPNKVRLCSQINTGVLIARRNLAKLSKGKYLLFVDSDDLLAKNALADIRRSIEQTDSDVVFFDLQKLADNGDERYTLPLDEGLYFNEIRVSFLKQLLLTKYSYGICQKVFKRGCFDFNADYERFRGMRIAEDVFQSFPIMDKAQSIYYLKKPLYVYRKNSGGATATVKLSDFHWCEVLYERQDEYIAKWEISAEDVQTVAEGRVRRMLGFLSVYAKQNGKNTYRQFKEFAKALTSNKLFCDARSKSSSKKLQKIYRMDLALLKLHWYRALYILHRSI